MYRGTGKRGISSGGDLTGGQGRRVRRVIRRDLERALRQLPEGVPAREMPGVGTQEVNDSRKVCYGRPCHPRGPAHRYFFKLYALDAEVALPPRKTKADLLMAIEGHVLGRPS